MIPAQRNMCGTEKIKPPSVPVRTTDLIESATVPWRCSTTERCSGLATLSEPAANGMRGGVAHSAYASISRG